MARSSDAGARDLGDTCVGHGFLLGMPGVPTMPLRRTDDRDAHTRSHSPQLCHHMILLCCESQAAQFLRSIAVQNKAGRCKGTHGNMGTKR